MPNKQVRLTKDKEPKVFDSEAQSGYPFYPDTDNTAYETPTQLFKYHHLTNEVA